MTDKEKQIEEMAIIIAKQNCKPSGCENCDYAYEYGTKEESCEDYVSYRRMAEAFYSAGYRKQVEGEWLERKGERWIGSEVCETYTYYSCSICEGESLRRTNHCPNCGVKMKGVAE